MRIYNDTSLHEPFTHRLLPALVECNCNVLTYKQQIDLVGLAKKKEEEHKSTASLLHRQFQNCVIIANIRSVSIWKRVQKTFKCPIFPMSFLHCCLSLHILLFIFLWSHTRPEVLHQDQLKAHQSNRLLWFSKPCIILYHKRFTRTLEQWKTAVKPFLPVYFKVRETSSGSHVTRRKIFRWKA